ncbi:MAG: HAD family phosphatase [Deltaproteobacteria bacterium]|nr:HAD family phosphatase [Deltaproteobacteria bacterium]
MLRALIFDFDGVIADAEPVHMRAFQEVLSEEGLSLSREEYYDRYLALDDKTFFTTVFKDRGKRFDKTLIKSLMDRKSGCYDRFIRENIVIFPGVPNFVKNASKRYALAIGSGALRHEIEFILEYAGIREEFKVITSAEDVTNCKPDPEVFIKALKRINASLISDAKIYPHECLVVEDSIYGIKAAHSAGMRCLAVSNSYPVQKLSEADMVVNGLNEVKIEDLEKLF